MAEQRPRYFLPARCALPQPLPLQLLFQWGSPSFKGLVIPHTRRCGTAEADAPINMYQSPQGRQPVWAEAPHRGKVWNLLVLKITGFKRLFLQK